MKAKQPEKTGFTYVLELDKIRAYMKLSVREKLQWLEEINKLNQAVYTKKNWEVIDKLKGKQDR